MSLKSDLIAARALIATPEKFAARGLLVALRIACGEDSNRVDAANAAVGGATAAHNPASRRFTAEAQERQRHRPSHEQDHADFMAQIDRAIAAAPDNGDAEMSTVMNLNTSESAAPLAGQSAP